MMTSVTPALAVTVINVQVVFVNLATLPTSVLKQHLGTIPLTRYVGLTDEVT